TLGVFLNEQFLPFINSTQTIKAKTREYYRLGTVHLLSAKNLSGLPLTEVDETHQAVFASRNKYSVSTLNRNLRTLRHALRLAKKWKLIDTAPDVTLAEGEFKRDRVVSDDEMKLYLIACLQPWKTIASIMFCLWMRPGEIYALRWEQVDFKDGFIFIVRGK